jgi:molybdopterin-guanine dinucleotide biosynthesis protein A
MKAAVLVTDANTVADDWQPLKLMVENCCEGYVVMCPEGVTNPAGWPVLELERTDSVSALKAALSWGQDEPVLLVATDITTPSAELARYLDYVRAGYDAVVPLVDTDNPQPLFGLYAPTCMGEINAQLLSGEFDIAALLLRLTVRFVDVEEVTKFGDPAQLLSQGG